MNSEFASVLMKHRLWLRSSGAEGQRAVFDHEDLRGVDIESEVLDFSYLRRVDLSDKKLDSAWFFGADLKEAQFRASSARGCNFAGADLSGANFEGADLRGAKFVGANLSGANLKAGRLAKADLYGTDLTGADLSFCDLSEALRLSDFQLKGANLEGAILPKGLAFAPLATARMCTGYSRKLFTAQLSICVYLIAFLYLPGVSHPEFERLPFLSIEVERARIPILLSWLTALIAANFRYYLARAWEQMSLLPSILPDGSSYEDYVDPWFVVSYSRMVVPHQWGRQSLPMKAEALIAGGAAYLLVPITLTIVSWSQVYSTEYQFLKSPLLDIPLLWAMFGGVLGLFSSVLIQLSTVERQKIRAFIRAAEFLLPFVVTVGFFVRYTLWGLMMDLREMVVQLFN